MLRYSVAFCFVLNFPFLKDLYSIQYVVYTVLYLFSTLSPTFQRLTSTTSLKEPLPTFLKTFKFQFYDLKEIVPLIVSNVILGEADILTVRGTHKG